MWLYRMMVEPVVSHDVSRKMEAKRTLLPRVRKKQLTFLKHIMKEVSVGNMSLIEH